MQTQSQTSLDAPAGADRSLQYRVQEILARTLPDAGVYLDTAFNGMVHGKVVSVAFERLPLHRQLAQIDRALKALPRRDRQHIGTVVPMTPAEYESYIDDQRYW